MVNKKRHTDTNTKRQTDINREIQTDTNTKRQKDTDRKIQTDTNRKRTDRHKYITCWTVLLRINAETIRFNSSLFISGAAATKPPVPSLLVVSSL